MKYAHIIAAFQSQIWLLRQETLFAMRDLLRLQAFEGVKWTDEEVRERIAAANQASGYEPKAKSEFRLLPIAAADKFELATAEWCAANPEARSSGKSSAGSGGTIAVVPITGVIAHRMAMMDDISGPGGASIQRITQQFRMALADDNCKAIIFDVDSPGGSVEGVMELASEIFKARKQKPLVAVSNAMAASAAYWLASSAGEFYCTPSGQVGSIGVYLAHQDESKALEMEGLKVNLISAGKYKTEGNPAEPLSSEARAALQSKVNDIYGMFVKGVSQNRGVSQTNVREGFGEGRMVLAKAAAGEKMIDGVATFDEVVERFGASTSSGTKAMASSAGMQLRKPDPKAEDSAECDCACEACKAGNCADCSNSECSDPECGHGPRAIARAQELATVAEQRAAADAAGDALASIQRRKRQLSLM